mgnify:CR=1 FL=1
MNTHEESVQIKKGKYVFTLKNRINTYENIIMSHAFYIGGVEDCIDLNINYKNNVPVSAHLIQVEYSSKCEMHANLDKGGGTRIMLYTLFEYLHNKFPDMKDIYFEDMSRIDCATITEKENKSRFLRGRSLVKPIDLCRFSIAFNGVTWYEKYFDAKLSDPVAHAKYREEVNKLLAHKPTIEELQLKPGETFEQIVGIYRDNENLTFKELCNKIPPEDRCLHARVWLIQYVSKILGNNFNHNGWVIKLPLNEVQRGGTRNRQSRKYYCPKGFRRSHFTRRECIESSDYI